MIAAFVEEAAAPARQSTAGRYAGMTLHEATKQFQLEFVHRALEEHRLNGRWNIAGASRALAVSRSFLYRVIEDIPENKRPEKDRR